MKKLLLTLTVLVLLVSSIMATSVHDDATVNITLELEEKTEFKVMLENTTPEPDPPTWADDTFANPPTTSEIEAKLTLSQDESSRTLDAVTDKLIVLYWRLFTDTPVNVSVLFSNMKEVAAEGATSTDTGVSITLGAATYSNHAGSTTSSVTFPIGTNPLNSHNTDATSLISIAKASSKNIIESLGYLYFSTANLNFVNATDYLNLKTNAKSTMVFKFTAAN